MMSFRLAYLIIAAALLFNCSRYEEPENTVARVGNESLTVQELKETIPAEYQKRISLDQLKVFIDRWVDTRLVYQEAVNRGYHNAYQSEVERQLKIVEIEFLANKLIEKYLDENIDISEQDIITFYENNKESFLRADDEIRAYHILASSKEEADQAIKKVRQGLSFEELCRQRRQLKQSLISNDGDMGYVSRGDVPQAIARELFRLKIDAVSRPVKTDFGYHIFKVLDKQSKGSYRGIEEARNQITEILKVEKRKEKYEGYLAQLRTHALEQKKLNLNLELLKEFSPDTTETF